jgi:flagellar assembly protein FliH
VLRARTEQKDREGEQRVRQAYQSGFQEGKTAGKAEADTAVEAELKRLAQLIAGVADVRTRMLRQAESDVVKLSIEIARRILRRELTIDPSAIEGLIKVALEKLEGQEIYRLRVHPDHEKIVRECIERQGNIGQIEIVGDPTQQRGDALFEIGRGTLDASIDTQLREIEQGLADRFRTS